MDHRVHEPVMVGEVLEHLAPRPGEVVLDLTVGAGGHSARIAERVGSLGRVVGTDRDPAILEVARTTLERFEDRVVLDWALSDDVRAVLQKHGVGEVHGALMDLGVSSLQLDEVARGFSFQRDAPLDMRMTKGKGKTARRLLEEIDPQELERILREYGEEPFARRIAQRLCELRRRRPVRTTLELARFVESIVPSRLKGRSRVHPATRVFQALRIAVNDELGVLERTLPAVSDALAPGGRFAVISFHSLEDRRVKTFFRDGKRDGLFAQITKKPIRPSEAEIARNPRARSARLRVAVKGEAA